MGRTVVGNAWRVPGVSVRLQASVRDFSHFHRRNLSLGPLSLSPGAPLVARKVTGGLARDVRGRCERLVADHVHTSVQAQPRQEPGIHLTGEPEHTQVLMAPAATVGVKMTEVSPAASMAPVTVITPAALTSKAVAYFVAVKTAAPPQVVEVAGDPVDCTISLTQVRAPLAASTTSEALARFV